MWDFQFLGGSPKQQTVSKENLVGFQNHNAPFSSPTTLGYCPAELRSHSNKTYKTHLGLHHPLCQLGKEFCGTAPVCNRADGADACAHGHDVGVTALEKRSVLGVIHLVFKHHTGVVDSSSATLGTPYLRHYTYTV